MFDLVTLTKNCHNIKILENQQLIKSSAKSHFLERLQLESGYPRNLRFVGNFVDICFMTLVYAYMFEYTLLNCYRSVRFYLSYLQNFVAIKILLSPVCIVVQCIFALT